MARNPTWQDIARISRRVDTHEEQIGELLEMSQIDHKTIALHGRELELIRKLSEAQTARITHVQKSMARMSRRIGARRG